MGDPVTTGVILGVASTAFDFVGGMRQASAIQQRAKQQQQIANMQAKHTEMVNERNALIARDQAKFNAEQLKRKAGQEKAVSQRKAAEARRQKDLALSRATAVAAASGGQLSDPTTVNILADLDDEGRFATESALYEGESAASLLNTQAAMELYQGNMLAEQYEYQGTSGAQNLRYGGQVSAFEGRQAASNARIKTIGTAATRGASLYSKYAPEDMGTTGGSGPGSFPTYSSGYYGPQQAPPTPGRNPFYGSSYG